MNGRRHLFIDMHEGFGPRRGDYIRSVGKRGPGTLYRVLTSRKVKRKDPNALPRYMMAVKVVEGLSTGRGRLFEFSWYPRKKKTFEQHMKRNVRGQQ